MKDWSKLEEFLSRDDVTHPIWFIGGGDCTDDQVKTIVDEAMGVFQSESIGIVTGGTDDGLPRIAAQSAKEHGLPTLGLLPKRAEEFCLEEFNDYIVYVSPKFGRSAWGDESEVGAKVVHGVIMIGGGVGTEAEYALSQKGEPKPLVAIEGTGGKSDVLNQETDYLTFETTPSKPISNGKKAAEFVLAKIK